MWHETNYLFILSNFPVVEKWRFVQLFLGFRGCFSSFDLTDAILGGFCRGHQICSFLKKA